MKNNGVGYGKISTRAQPSWRKAIESVRKQIAAARDQGHGAVAAGLGLVGLGPTS